jgi:hypothetical protein
MENMNNNKATPTKDTGAKGSTASPVSDYKYSPRVENPNPKSAKNKAPSSGNIRGI